MYPVKPEDSTDVLNDFDVTFTLFDKDLIVERVVGKPINRPGYYYAHLLPDQTYIATLRLATRNCVVSTLEIYIGSKFTSSNVYKKDFWLFSPDSTEYGGCMAGWHHVRRYN